MQIKTSELTGTQLDWAVAQCEGKKRGYAEHLLDIEDLDLVSGVAHSMIQRYSPSSNPAQSYPIIEREGIGFLFDSGSACQDSRWFATLDSQQISTGYEGESFEPTYMVDESAGQYGPTPLIAAMRAYVTYKLGAYVEIPDSLNQTQPAP